MIWLVLGMLLAVVLASFVLATVALPARRAGRPMFTARGAKLFHIGDEAPRRETAASDKPAGGRSAGAHGVDDRSSANTPPGAQ